jgi:hypothetical protein
MNTLFYGLILVTLILIGFLIYLFVSEKDKKISVPEDYPLTLKYRIWIGEHYKTVIIATIVFLLLSSNTVILSYMLKEKQLNLCHKTLNEMANKVLILTPDKKVINVFLSNLKPEAIKYYFDDRISDFIISKLCILGKEQFPESYQEIPKYCYNAKKILESGLLSEEGKRLFMMALKGIYTLAKMDRLPEIILPEETISKAYLQIKDNITYFKYVAEINSYIKYIPLGSKEIYQAKGLYRVTLVGHLDPEKGSIKNPYGVVIDYVKLEPPLKPNA